MPTRREQAEATNNALFELQANLRNAFSVVQGEVAQLVESGFTPDQARAIVATTFGWRPPSDGE